MIENLDEGAAAPAEPSADEIESLHDAVVAGVMQGLEDPLLDLTREQRERLRDVAYWNGMELDRVEALVKRAMRDANYDAEAVKKFNLSTFRRGAKELRKQLADRASVIAKMRARNLKIVKGGQPDDSLKAIPEGADATVAAWSYSQAMMLQACAWLMHNRRGRVWFDEFHNNYFTDWSGDVDDRVVETVAVSDAWMLRCWTTMLSEDTRLAKMGLQVAQNAVHRVAADDVRNEPRAWLQGLVWDGVERLPTWLHEAYGTPQDTYHASVGRCWLVSIAARIMTPGCQVDTMPVLIGKQGTQKSRSLEALAGKWYVAVNVSAEKPQDFLATLAGKIVAELPELDAIASMRVSKQRVKALLSTAVDVYRPPYGRTAQEFRRVAVFAGTTNEAGWHSDETGGRRFWPVEVGGEVNLQWIRDNREQLFAEAAARLRRGEQWWDFDRREQERRMDDHYVEDGLIDRLRDAIEARRGRLYTGPGCGVEPVLGDPEAGDEEGHWGTLITTSWVCAVVMQLPVERQTGVTAKRVAHALTKLGFRTCSIRVRNKYRNGTKRCWVSQLPGKGDGGEEQTEMAV